MAEHKIRQKTTTPKKKKPEEDRFGKKGKQQAKKAKAEKTGASKLNKTGNSRADERREGAVRARENPVNKTRGGAQNYIIKDKVQPILTAPTKTVSGALKNAQNTAGQARNQHRGGHVTNVVDKTNRSKTHGASTTVVTTPQTKRNDRLTAKGQVERDKAIKANDQKIQTVADTKAKNDKNGYAYGGKLIKTLDKYNEKVDKALEEGKKKDLEYAAESFSDKKVDIPFYTKYAKGKAEAEAKKALKEGGVTQKKGKENVDNWITETESNWDKSGFKVTDDTVVTEDGKTWGQIKQEAYDQEAARIRFERSKYINQSTNGVGQLSAQDIVKGGIEMGSEFIDYGVPYMATAKGSIKVAEKLMAKAAKAGKTGAKVAPKTEAAIGRLVADGKLTPQAAKKLNTQIAIKSGAKSFSKELVANALQDATIGTAIDLGKGIEQGLQGKDLEKYMKDNAIANLALGIPMSGIAGRAGAKEAKQALAEDIAGSVNKFTNLTREEGFELDNLIKKSNDKNATLGNFEAQRLSELQDKALGGDSAVVNSKGKIEVNKAETTVEGLSREDAKEYIKLRAKAASGQIQPHELGNLAGLQKKVEQAYKQTEAKAQKTINISNKRITSAMQEDAEMAVRFFERTGDKARLKQANDVLERAKKATAEKNAALETNIDKMKDITKGNYRWVDSKEMEALTGDGRIGGYYDEATGEIVVNRDSPQAYQTIIGHETMHMLKAANREGYDKLANMLADYVKELDEYDSLVAEVKQAYPELVAKGDADALDEELVSEMLGRYVFGEDDTFIKKLAGEDPTTLQKIINYIKKLFANNDNAELREQFAKLEQTALEQIRDAHPEVIARENARKKWSRIVDSSGERVDVADRQISARVIDQCYLDAVKCGDLDLAQRIVDQHLLSQGFGIPAFHGTTRFGFTTVDMGKLDDGASIFAARSPAVAHTYTGSYRSSRPNVKKIGNPKEPLKNKIQHKTKWDIDHLNGVSKEYLGIDLEIDKYLDDLTGVEATINGEFGRPRDFSIDDYMEWDNPVTGKHNDSTPIELFDYATGDERGDFVKDYSLYNKIKNHIRDEYRYDKSLDAYTKRDNEFELLDIDERDELLELARDIDNEVVKRLTEYFGTARYGENGIYQVRLKMNNPLIVDCGGSWWNDIDGSAFKYSVEDKIAIENFHAFEEEYKEYVEDVIEDNITDADNVSLNALLDDGKYEEYYEFKNDLEDYLMEIGQIVDEDEFVGRGMSKVFKTNDEYDDAYDVFIEKGRAVDNDDKTYNTRYVSQYARNNGYDGVIFKDIVDTGNGRYIEDDVYIVFSNEQMKSADPVTYDDNGNIIPPSRRGLGDKVEAEKSRSFEKKALENHVEVQSDGALMDVDTGVVLYDPRDGWKDSDFDWEKTHGISEKEYENWLSYNNPRSKRDMRYSKFGVKGATGEQKALGEQAEQMFKDGVPVDEIYYNTGGWVVDSDGKAKMRFSDKDMKLNIKMKSLKPAKSVSDIQKASDAWEAAEDAFDKAVARNADDAELGRLLGNIQKAEEALDIAQNGVKEIPLGELIEHNELFKRYPKFKDDITVKFTTKSYIGGEGMLVDTGGGTFTIYVRRNGLTKEKLKETLVHEVQHAIQDTEGFARGTSPEEWQRITKKILSEMDDVENSLPSGFTFEKDGSNWVIKNSKTGSTASASKPENVRFDFFKGIDARELRAKFNEWVDLKNDLDAMTTQISNAPDNVRREVAKQGKFQYSNTKGEFESRNAEYEMNEPLSNMRGYDEVEARERTKMNRGQKPDSDAFVNEHELKVEDYEKKYGGKKASKFAKETQNAKTSRETVNATKKEKKALEQKLSGKLSKDKRAEVEDQLVKLEERLEKETAFMHQSNTPIYKKRIEENRKAIKELEKELKKTKDADEIKKIQKQITNKERWITTNENWINWKPKQVVSDVPVKELSDGELSKEYNSINKELKKEQESIRTKRLLEERRDALSKEAEKRDLDLRGNLEKADELIKEKRFGYEEAEELTKKIREIDEQVAELDAKKKTTARVHKIDSLEAERKKLNTRLSNVIENSKSVVPEGKTAKETFNKVVGGNTLKAKGEGKMLNKFSVRKLLDENDGSKWGATKDLGRAFRRKTESSLIEYESTGKQLIKDGHKELGQALLDQANNVTVYKNKAAAAVESARASADGTKIGKSLNDVFKVEDKNGKIVDLLLEENAEMRQDLSNYLFCKHSFAREEQGKKVFGVIDEDGKPKWTNASTEQYMKEIEKEYGKKTVKAFEREIRDFIDYLNEYRLDTGLMSKELLDKLNDIYPYYIPTNRAVVNKPPKEYELPKNVAEVENGIKRAVGGDAPLEDLYTQLVKMTMATIRSGEQNKLLAMYAKAHNIEPTRLPKDTTADDVLESSVEAFDSDHRGNYKIRFYDNGEAVTIPVNKHAAKGIREFNGQDYATLIEVSAKLGKLLHMREYKGLITDWNLVFGVRNGMRDAQQALVNSKDSRYFTASIPRARAAVANENNAFRVLYDANGGRYSTLQQINRLDEIGALNKKGGTVAKGLEKIEDINGAIEMMPRMCEFIGTIQKEADNILGSKGIKELKREIEAEASAIPEAERTAWIENEYAQRIVDLIKKEKPDIIATAIRNSADVTVNFSRSGVVTKAFNAGFVPYLNPSVQGLSKMMRMFTESKAQGFGKLACFGAKLSVLTIAPAMLNEILCKDNEAYQSINSRDKDNAFFIPMSLFGGEPDKFIKIPKPRENAVLAEPFEYGLRYFMDKAQYGTLDEFKQMFLSAEANVGIVNVWEDNIASPILNTMMNKTWYGGDILSKQELKNVENDEAWKNYDETTSWFAKKMGKLANISPKKVDNILDSYTGLIYDFGISQTSQKNLNDVYSSPKNFVKNNPFVQQFMKDAVFSNKYATKFWDKADELNEGHNGDKDTIEYREYMAKYGYDTFTYDSAIAGVDNDKNIPKEEKVEIKRELRKCKNQLLQRALNGEEVKYDPMQRIINIYKRHGIENATDICLSSYAEGDHADAYKHLKQSKEYRDATDAEKLELQRKFLKTYKGVKRIARFTGDSDKFVNYSTVEYVCAKNGYTGGLIANMYAWKSKEYAVEKGLKDMKRYIDAGYTEKNFKVTMRAMNRGAEKLGDPDKPYASKLEDYNKAMINAENGYRDGAYLVASPYIKDSQMNAARCLTEGHSGEDFKWTNKRVNKFCKKYEIYADKNYKYDNEQVANAVKKEYGDKTPEEQAAVYVLITGDTEGNPFGEIGDYSHKNDSGLLEDEEKKGKGGRGRGRGRRGGGGGGKGSKGTMPSTSSGAINGKVTDVFAGSNGSKASTLNDAYRKKVRKLREQMYK